MSIKHKLVGGEIKYGYIWWSKKDDAVFKTLLPRGDKRFSVMIMGDKIPDRKVDWGRRRIYLGIKFKEKFKKDDVVIISRKPKSNVVEIRRK